MINSSEDWLGKRLLKGVCSACIGVIQFAEKNFVSGLLNLTKSTKYLKLFEKSGISYKGQHEEMIRSASYFCLGLLQIMNSVIVDTKGKLAKWLSGFSGNRKKGLENLYICYKNKGCFAPWASLVYTILETDSNFLSGEEDKDHLEPSHEMINWMKTIFNDSGLVTLCEISLAENERDMERVKELIKTKKHQFKLTGPKLLLSHKSGLYFWSQLNFCDGGKSFKIAMDDLMKVGQRGMVPYNASYAFLSFLQVLKELEDEEGEVSLNKQISTERTVGRLLRIFDWCMKRKTYPWGQSDKEVLKWIEQYIDFKEVSEEDIRHSIRQTLNRVKESWVLLDICERLVFDVRCSSQMSFEMIEKLLEKLKNEEKENNLKQIEYIRLRVIESDLLLQLNEQDKVTEKLNEVFKSVDKHTKNKRKTSYNCYLALGEFYRARIAYRQDRIEDSKQHLKKIKKYGEHKYRQSLRLKSKALLTIIGDFYSDTHTKITVAPRGKVTYRIDLAEAKNTEDYDKLIEWSIVGSCSSPRIEISHKMKKKSKKQIFESVAKDTDLRSEINGTLKALPEKGMLNFIFDNQTNMLHSKTFHVQLNPPLVLEIVKKH